MRIDAHNHFWFYSLQDFPWINEGMRAIRRDFVPDDLRQHQLQATIDGTVAVQARQSLDETNFLLNCANKHEFILGVVGWIDIANCDIGTTLGKLGNAEKLRGFRHVLQDEPDEQLIRSEGFRNGLIELLDRGFTYDILINSSQLDATLDLLHVLPEGKLILDHLAKPDFSNGSDWEEWSQFIAELGRNLPHVHCKISGMVTETSGFSWTADTFDRHLDHLFDHLGGGRLMFGSDWPVCNVAASYQEVVEVVERYILKRCPSDLDQVMGENAQRFYALVTTEEE